MIAMLRRDVPPQTEKIEHFNLDAPEKAEAPFGQPLYIVPGEKHEVVRLDLLFKSGTYIQKQPLQASAASFIASEATRRYSSSRLSELVDFYGGWIQRAVYMHTTHYTLYAPKRNYGKLLSAFVEIFTTPRFSSRDLALYKKRGKAEYRQLSERVEYMSAKSLKKQLYQTHPYGTVALPDDFDKLTIPILEEYYDAHYRHNSRTAVLSGNIDDKTVAQTTDALSRLSEPDEEPPEKKIPLPQDTGEYICHDTKDGAMQCCIRIGSIMPPGDEAEYLKLGVVNTLLGGYFGSRLMSKIREEKGYTYGISSGITTLRYATTLNIMTQCALRYAAPLIKEVNTEIDKLKNHAVQSGETDSAKQYMLGEMNRIFDNRFTLADAYLAMLINEQPFSYLNRKAETILSITPEEITATAAKYLNTEKMHIAVAGGDKNFGDEIKSIFKK